MMQVSFVGQTEEAAREAAQKGGFADKLGVSKTSFKANSKVHLPNPGNLWLPSKKIRMRQVAGPLDALFPLSMKKILSDLTEQIQAA